MRGNFLSIFLLVIIIASCEKKPVDELYKIPNYRVSSYGNEHPNEVSIAVNPKNTDNVVIGSNIHYYYWSFTGGTTWSERTLESSQFGVWGDPVLMFDENGYLYYSHLSNPVGPAWIDRIVVQKSTSGGQTWQDGVGIGLNTGKEQDKEWMGLDRSSTMYNGSLYLSWTEFDNYGSSEPEDKSRIRFSYSRDEAETWSEPLVISDTEGNCVDSDSTMEGAVPAVGNNGDVYIAWSGPDGIYFDKSADGGVSFGTDKVISDMPGGWDISIPGIYRCNGMPFTVCDNSDSEYSGNIYVLWSDQRNGETDTEIFLLRSEDGGDTWSERITVNNDNSGTQQFFPNIVVDPTSGIIYVVYYDRSKTSGLETDVWMAKSDDGAKSFTNFKISVSPFTPVDTIFFGDYIDIDAYNGIVYASWMRMDNEFMSVFCAKVLESELDNL